MKSAFAIIFALLSSAVFGEGKAVIQSVRGQAEVRAAASGKWEPARAGMELAEGAVISTGFSGFAGVLSGGELLNVTPLMRAVCTLIDDGEGGSKYVLLYDGIPVASRVQTLRPAPPIGFGSGERIKTRQTATRAEEGDRELTGSSLKNAGFTPAFVVPRTTSVTIDIVWQ